MIEILVSAVILTVIAGAIFTLLNATARSAAEDRHRTEAYALAQEDQARLRSMRIAELNKLEQTQPVTLNGTEFTITSIGVFVNNTTTNSSCSSKTNSADYVRITSTVSWPTMGSRPAAAIQSIVAPANGSLDPSHGTLTVSVKNAQNLAIPGITLTGSGAGTFTGQTDAEGCAMFPDQPSGEYMVAPSGLAAGLVDKDGKVPGQIKVGITGETTTPLILLYDRPGSIREVVFQTKNAEGQTVTSSSDAIVVFNTEMTSAKTFGTPGGTRTAAIAAPLLFPFAAPDAVYAGSCTGDNPNPTGDPSAPGAAAIAAATIPAAGVLEKVTLQLPPLYLTVKNGASVLSGARVTISDDNCTVSGSPVKRVYTTTPAGRLSSPSSASVEDPGLPWSTFDICASASISGNTRRNFATNVAVNNMAGTSQTIDLSGTGSQSGSCP